jgi:L-fuconolactonase
MRVDSHQHFWRYSATEYPWMTEPLAALRRDYLPEHLHGHLEDHGMAGSIAVQARQSLAESRELLDLAAHHPSIKGVVGWVDLRSEAVARQLEEFAPNSRFVGVRHVVQDEPDDNFMLRADFQRGIALLKQFDLAYDILIYPRQLPAAIELVTKFPEQPFVLDHIAKPMIKSHTMSPWQEQIRDLARRPNVHCKISGMVTEAAWGQWEDEDFRPYLDVVFEAFGVGRLMYGSDWPVCLLSAGYEHVFNLVRDYVRKLPQPVREKILGENAVEFYGIKL